MAENIDTLEAEWSPVPQLETSTDAIGGKNGPMNDQAVALVKRSNFLRERADALATAIAALVDSAAAFASDATAYLTGTRISAKTGEAWDVVDSGEHFTHPVSGIKLKIVPVIGYYTDSAFLAKANGVDDDAVAWQRMAASVPAGATIRLSAGVRIIGAAVTFAQDRLVMVFDRGARVKQASGTGSIDTLLKFAGNNGVLSCPSVDANVAGNPTHTGRGQLLEIAGNYWNVENFQGEGSQIANGFGTCLYVTGNFNRFNGVSTNNSGANAVRNRGNFNEFLSLSLMGWRGHGWVQDAAVDSSPQTYTRVSGGIIRTDSATATEGILTDPDGIQCGQIDVSDIFIESTQNTHANVLKFVYTSQVNLTNVTTRHAAGPLNCSLRLQEKVDKLNIRNCRFDGGIAFGGTDPCDTVISGASVLCEKYNMGAAVISVNGSLVVEDGVEARNLGTAFCSTSSTPALGNAANIQLGRLILHGAAGNSPCAVQLANYSVANARRIRAGQVSVANPLRVSGTMRTLQNEGRWVGLSETQDACCRQGDDRAFLAANSDAPPRDSEGWRRHDTVKLRVPVAGAVPGYVCTSPGAACRTSWAGNTAYAVNAWVANGGNVYVCTGAGTSAASGGPTGAGANIADGTATWAWIDAQAVFKALPAIAV